MQSYTIEQHTRKSIYLHTLWGESGQRLIIVLHSQRVYAGFKLLEQTTNMIWDPFTLSVCCALVESAE